MSRLSKLIRKVAPVAAPIIGVMNPALGAAIGGIGAAFGSGRVSAPEPAPVMTSNLFGMAPAIGRALPALGRVIPGLGAAAGGAVRVGMAGARRVFSAASSYCRKHPGWCQTIGGVAAVEAMIQRGELPLPKRRRGRGISATELKHFKRVARFTSKYCAPVRRAMSSRAVRGGKSCR